MFKWINVIVLGKIVMFLVNIHELDKKSDKFLVWYLDLSLYRTVRVQPKRLVDGEVSP